MSTAIADALSRAGFDRLKFDAETFARNFFKAGGSLALWQTIGEEIAKETGGGHIVSGSHGMSAAAVVPSAPGPNERGAPRMAAGRAGNSSSSSSGNGNGTRKVVHIRPTASQLAARRSAGHSSVPPRIFEQIRLPSGRRYIDLNTDEYVRLAVEHQQHATLLMRLRQIAVQRGKVGGRFTTKDLLTAREFAREFGALRHLDLTTPQRKKGSK